MPVPDPTQTAALFIYTRLRDGVWQPQTLPFYEDGGILKAARVNRVGPVVIYTAAVLQTLARRI